MQALPSLIVDGEIDVTTSNHDQQRDSHGLFRFFGKLAPDVTACVLDVAAELLGNPCHVRLVDIMCGSGTTVIEAQTRGWLATGIDVNPAALLFARVKTRALKRCDFVSQLEWLTRNPWEPSRAEVAAVFRGTKNADRWFSEDSQREIAKLRLLLNRLGNSCIRDALLATLLGRLRAYSNASNRTGRIFFDPGSAVRNVTADFCKQAMSLVEHAPASELPCELMLADARALPVNCNSTDIVFCHPPYFGLYRFSSDVLRFELEIGGWDRGQIARREIEEGWKSGDPAKLDSYVRDMGGAFEEAKRIMRRGAILSVVTSNSTLGDMQLPVIDRLAERGNSAGFQLARHVVRKAHFGSASYHRSARTDKVIQRDHVLFFRAG